MELFIGCHLITPKHPNTSFMFIHIITLSLSLFIKAERVGGHGELKMCFNIRRVQYNHLLWSCIFLEVGGYFHIYFHHLFFFLMLHSFPFHFCVVNFL